MSRHGRLVRRLVLILFVLVLAAAGLFLWFEKPAVIREIVEPHATSFNTELGREHAIGALENFDEGTETELPDGRLLREYWMEASDRDVEVAPGVPFRAWAFNDGVPGPTMRCASGDSVLIHFRNLGASPHSLMVGGFVSADTTVISPIAPGREWNYAFTATAPGIYVYYSSVLPVSREIARGLCGLLVIDPGRPVREAHEMVMILQGFDTRDVGAGNDVYAINGFADVFLQSHPIAVKTRELQRVYLANLSAADSLITLRSDGIPFAIRSVAGPGAPSESTHTLTLVRGHPAIVEFRCLAPGRFPFAAAEERLAHRGMRGVFDVKP